MNEVRAKEKAHGLILSIMPALLHRRLQPTVVGCVETGKEAAINSDVVLIVAAVFSRTTTAVAGSPNKLC